MIGKRNGDLEIWDVELWNLEKTLRYCFSYCLMDLMFNGPSDVKNEKKGFMLIFRKHMEKYGNTFVCHNSTASLNGQIFKNRVL